MPRGVWAPLLALLLAAVASAQQPGASSAGVPEANPSRPTVSTPATLTPVGYLQFESGYLGASHSPEFSSQSSFNEVIKFAVSRRIQFLAGAQPFAHSRTSGQSTNDAGDVSLGVQGVIYPGKGATPTVSLSYWRRVYNGPAPNLDIGSPVDSAIILVSDDVKGFHYDTNYLFNRVADSGTSRLQYGQTLSVSHPIWKKFGATGEIWRFTQPFLNGNAVGTLWAVTYNARKNLVFDAGFDRGLTSTSTRWEVFAGFTYVLPHRLLPH